VERKGDGGREGGLKLLLGPPPQNQSTEIILGSEAENCEKLIYSNRVLKYPNRAVHK